MFSSGVLRFHLVHGETCARILIILVATQVLCLRSGAIISCFYRTVLGTEHLYYCIWKMVCLGRSHVSNNFMTSGRDKV